MILRGDSLRFPSTASQLFGRDAPLILEIGFGNGGFLEELAGALPDHNFLGVEKAMASVSRAHVRLRRRADDNVRLFHGTGEFVVRDLLATKSLQRVYVNFPDPWPRKGHRDRRLIQQPFLRLLSTRLVETGTMIFTSDHEEYFDYAVEQGRRCDCFELTVQEPSTEYLSTKYAVRWLKEHRRIQQAVFKKLHAAEESYPPRTEICDMYHVLMDGKFPRPDAFEKTTIEHRDGHVVLTELLQSVDGERLFFQLLTVEPDLRQDVIVEARPSKSGHMVCLSHFGSPAITRLVRDSVGIVADWLSERGMTIVQRTY